MKNILLTAAISLIVGFNVGRTYQLKDQTGPASSKTIQPEYPFQAKLVTRPDHSKQMQWKAVPLTYGWKDTILVDFDYGGGMDFNFREGDVVNLIGIRDNNGDWFYRHDDQYWMRERHQKYLRR